MASRDHDQESPKSPIPQKSIADLLAELPDEERIILTLHYMRGLSSAKIAGALGVPERAVDGVITRGKAALLAALSQSE